MPTILEHLAALFDKDMRAVLNNPRAISMIANPSARVQMAAVRKDQVSSALLRDRRKRYS